MTSPRTTTAGRAAQLMLLGMVGVTACSRPNREGQPVRQVSSERVREPAVAGPFAFYPDNPDTLKSMVDGFLAQAAAHPTRGLRALVCPHAGYRYSGPVAASGFKQLAGTNFDQVMVLAPSHHVAFRGVAVPDVDALRTPLGKLQVADGAKKLAQSRPFVLDSAPHAREHALEVELPFLQRTLGAFTLWPLVFGSVDPEQVARSLNALLGPTTLLVASSDLSHFYPYDTAVTMDRATIDAILRGDLESLGSAEACGKGPVMALVHVARLRGWKAELLDYRNSGDTAGDRSRVVGYAAIGFYQSGG